MKIDENMIEQMTEEEQQELIELLEKQQRKKKKRIVEELVEELREVLNKLIHEDVTFDFVIHDKDYDYYTSIDVEAENEGEDITFTLYR